MQEIHAFTVSSLLTLKTAHLHYPPFPMACVGMSVYLAVQIPICVMFVLTNDHKQYNLSMMMQNDCDDFKVSHVKGFALMRVPRNLIHF